MNAETVVVVASSGQTYFHDNVVDCRGIEETKADGHQVKKSFVVTQHNIILRVVKFTAKESCIYNPNTREVLKCHLLAHSCVDATKVSVWSTENYDDLSCQVKIVNQFSGYLENDGGDRTFTDADKKFRVSLIKPVVLCKNINAISTPYPHLFMVEGGKINEPLLKSTKPQLADWVASRDDFLASYAEKLLSESESDSMMDKCIKELAFQPTSNGLHHIADNLFNLIRGELTYAIACRVLTVAPRLLPTCYNDLPVRDEHGQELFLEPQTRLLKKYSVENAKWSRSCPTSSFGLHYLASPEQIEEYVSSTWSEFKRVCVLVGQVSAVIVVLYLVLALIDSLVKMLLRCRLLIPRHGLNRRTLAASLSLCDYIYGQWYRDEPLFEEQLRKGVPPPTERTHMLC